jgi:hypothetical protein
MTGICLGVGGPKLPGPLWPFLLSVTFGGRWLVAILFAPSVHHSCTDLGT